MWLRIIVKGVAKVLRVSVSIQVNQYFAIPALLITSLLVLSFFMKKISTNYTEYYMVEDNFE